MTRRRAAGERSTTTLDIEGRLLYFRWSAAHNRERIVRAIVWALPHQIVMWCFYRVWANATSGEFGNEHPDGLNWHVAIERWERHQGGDPAFWRHP